MLQRAPRNVVFFSCNLSKVSLINNFQFGRKPKFMGGQDMVTQPVEAESNVCARERVDQGLVRPESVPPAKSSALARLSMTLGHLSRTFSGGQRATTHH